MELFDLLRDDIEKFTEKTLSSELIFDGHIVNLYRDEVMLPNGKTAAREVIRHIGAVGIVPLTDDRKIILVRQYRYALGRMLFEIPAGKLNFKDEDPVAAAERELEEETGYLCSKIEQIGDLHSTVGFCDEVIHLYAAYGLKTGRPHPDDDEFVDTVQIPLDEAVKLVMEGKLTDAKTQTGILKLNNIIRNK